MTEHVKLQGSVRLPRRKVASAASVKSSFQVPFKIQSPGKVCKRDGKLCMFTHVYAIIFPGGACAVMALLLLAWTDFGKHVKFCFSPTGRETEAWHNLQMILDPLLGWSSHVARDLPPTTFHWRAAAHIESRVLELEEIYFAKFPCPQSTPALSHL